MRWPGRVPATARERPLPFVTRQWAIYLDLIETNGLDFGGDDLALIAAEEEAQLQLAAFIARQPNHNAPGREPEQGEPSP